MSVSVVAKNINLALEVNGHDVLDIVTWHQRVFHTGANTGLLRLTKGDVVCVVAEYKGELMGSPFPFSTFTGVLLAVL